MIWEILLFLVIITIPISFRNILGGEFSEFPLPLFYLFGLALFLYQLFFRMSKNNLKGIKYIQLIIVITLILSILPLVIATNKFEAFKEFVTYSFFLCLYFVGSAYQAEISEKKYDLLLKIYILGCSFSALGILFQYFMFTYFNTELFKILHLGGNRLYLSFMFYDMSSATLYIASGIILLLLKKYYIPVFRYSIIIISMTGMVLSSARAGIIVFLLTLFLYYTFTGKLKTKIIGLILVTTVLFSSLHFIQETRNLSGSSSVLFDDTGRFDGYLKGISYFFESPTWGKGYDLGLKMQSLGEVVPHSALFYMLPQTGIIITTLFIILIYYMFSLVAKKKREELFWVLVLSIIGSFVVPGFFSARFFTALAIIVLVAKPYYGRKEGV